MAEPVEGKLVIRLLPNASGNGVEISSSRPVTASRLFIGKQVTFALQTIPLLFNICGNSQLISSLRATESARRAPAHDESEEWREALLLLETLREQLWRVLLDWPRLSHYEPAMESLARFNRELNQFIQLLRSDPGITGSSNEPPRVRIDQLHWQRLAAGIVGGHGRPGHQFPGQVENRVQRPAPRAAEIRATRSFMRRRPDVRRVGKESRSGWSRYH